MSSKLLRGKPLLALAAAGAAALFALVAIVTEASKLVQPGASQHPSPVAAGSIAAAGPTAALASPPSSEVKGLAASPRQVPPGVSAEQWQQLVAELSAKPDGAAELSRLAEYFRFSDALQRFRQARRQTPPGAELVALARQIDGQLDARVRQREVNGGEARAIKAALLEVLQPDDDEAARQAALASWSASAQAAALSASPAVAAARMRDAEFMRQQAVIVAAWSAKPPAERDQRRLETELAALQRATYPGPHPSPHASPHPSPTEPAAPERKSR